MVTRQSQATARSINGLLQERDILGLAAIAGGTAGGVLLTQRLANRVLPAVGLSPTPDTFLEGAGAAGLKGAIAAGFMFAALQVGGVAQVLLAFFSIGALTSAGFDLATLFFDVPSLRQMRAASTSGARRTRSNASNNNGTARAVSTSSGGQTATVGGSNF
jgi:hypothetical protein